MEELTCEIFFFFRRSILECKDVLDKISQDKLSRLTHNIVKVSNA